MEGVKFTFADPDFHVPPERWGDPEVRYRPSRPPADWSIQENGFWTRPMPEGHVMAVQGWKVHVSAQLELGGQR